MRRTAAWSFIAAAVVGGCKPAPQASQQASTSSASAQPATSAAPSAKVARVVPERREGQALVRAEGDDALYLADEDHKQLRRIELTAALTTPGEITTPPTLTRGDARETALDLPGRPAQAISLGDRVLVTVRDPGLLVVVSPSMKEVARVTLPGDAWGLAISPDGRDAYVTSAWTHQLSRVDVSTDTPRVVWSIDVAREPRGVTVSSDGKKVYVSHLMGADVTVASVDGAPKVTRVALPPDPEETLAGETLNATLGYAAVLSPDGRRLFTARHAMGAMWAWQGRTTVDVLSTVTDEPVAPKRGGRPLGQFTSEELKTMSWLADGSGTRAESDGARWVQPRAMIYRKKTGHLLVASEGMARLAELDAMSVSPGLITNRLYRLGGLVKDPLPKFGFAPDCGAPTGIALSRDEDVAWVYCRTTDNVVAVRLTPDGKRASRNEIQYLEGGEFHDKLSPWGPFALAKLSVPTLPEDLAIGRRLYFDAQDPVVSDQMACAGCHPDGRDDGHVWRERASRFSKELVFLAGPSLSADPNEEGPQVYGMARQTPMLAGRVSVAGPFGWHGESATVVDRIRAGFGLHRREPFRTDGQTIRMRADPIARFVKEGLVAPPVDARPLTAQETRGQEVFNAEKTRCATCHAPQKGFTDGSVTPLTGFRTPKLFTDDPNLAFKAPSLKHVGHTPPYYHDGSALTLDELIDKNMDRMGKTSHLSADDRAALVAYLRTL